MRAEAAQAASDGHSPRRPPHSSPGGESLLIRLRNAVSRTLHLNKANQKQQQRRPASLSSSATKRACFGVHGSVGNTIGPQTVLPNLADFSYDRSDRCPFLAAPTNEGGLLEQQISGSGSGSNANGRHAKCELWKMTTSIGDKKNTYKMWIRRDAQTGLAIPVHYYMLGYDSLLGSHYDRYDIHYRQFQANAAGDRDFVLGRSTQECGPMPGPGDSSSASSSARRASMIVQNPIHEFVSEPHRYDHIDHEFEKFAGIHKREYSSDEHKRKGWHNFLHNFRFIHSKNRQLKTYKLDVNRYADNNVRELTYLRGRLRSSGYNGGLDYAEHHKDVLKGANGAPTGSSGAGAKLPDTWDWSIRGAVTPVKDQAVCGSCWSFGTSGTIEGAYFVKNGHLPKLSQQQMIDCSWKFGNNGCDGGEDFRAYKYLMEAGGLASEEDYGSYMGIDGKCHDGDVKKTAKISGFYNVTSNNVEALKHALVTYGPVTVAIDASRPTFTFYSHGIYYDEKCNNSPDGLDHQVLAVGYAKVDGKLVWLIKNSWSTYWGNDGYILMSAENNNCGVMDSPTVPIIETDTD